ncbi:MAG: hypothetical protein HY667_02465 [Chloroflexi bacterium]|nr:hypothetical protein [Chloroflexota bacterium]
MTEKPESQTEPKKCLVCKATSHERVLLRALEKGQEVWVCVRCLPMLIHGGH